MACRQGTLTPPDTWSRSYGTCICSTCRDQSFSELVVIFLDYALRISLSTFSNLHYTIMFDLLTLTLKFDLLLKNFNLGHNFLTKSDKAFILYMKLCITLCITESPLKSLSISRILTLLLFAISTKALFEISFSTTTK